MGLNILTNIIKDYIYDKEKINKEQFINLKEEISSRYLERYRKKINTLDGMDKEDKEKQTRFVKDMSQCIFNKDK